jgi:putative transposase
VLRYIHQNPVKANMIRTIDAYKWTSYNEYAAGSKIVDVKFALDIFSEDQTEALISLIRFN